MLLSLLRPRSRAFTLLELIVVVVILGILAAIAVPTFQEVIAKSHDASAGTSLQAVARDTQALDRVDGIDVHTLASLATAVGETTGSAAAPGTSAAALPFVLAAGSQELVPGDFSTFTGSDGYGVVGAALDTTSTLLGLSMRSRSGRCVYVTATPSGTSRWTVSRERYTTCLSGPAIVIDPKGPDGTRVGVGGTPGGTTGSGAGGTPDSPGGGGGGGTVPPTTPSTATPAPSPTGTVNPPVVVPPAPTNVVAVAGDASAIVTFDLPSQVGTGAVYTVTSTRGDTDDVTESPGTFTGLVNGQPYRFRVTVTSSLGTATSLLSNLVTPYAQLTRSAVASGTNTDYRLGDGSTTLRKVFVDVTNLPGEPDQVVAGDNHSCALVDGGVWCWGANASGQLGNGTTSFSPSPVAGPVVGLDAGVTQIASGKSHTCAVQYGAVKCWGAGGSGQLGNGASTNQPAPVGVVGLSSGVTSVSAGAFLGCAVKDGAAWCWGQNNVGQLGDGSLTLRKSPVAVQGLSSGVTAVASGYFHNCAVQDGGLKCWGENNVGQLGDGTTSDHLAAAYVSGMETGVTAVDLGLLSCAVQNGGAKCWGSGSTYGSLGDGSATNRYYPVNVVGLGSGVTSIAAGDRHACAVKDGAGWCWGANGGQLGHGDTTTNVSTPFVPMGLESGVVSFAAGAAHTIAIRER